MINIAHEAVSGSGDRNLFGRPFLSPLRNAWAAAKQLLSAAPITTAITAVALLLQLQTAAHPTCELWFPQLSYSSLHKLAACHLLHWSWNHFAWDIAVFVVAGAICESRWKPQFLSLLAVSIFAIPITVAIAQPELLCYRGLSGIDSALFALAAGMFLTEEVRSGNWQSACPAGLAVLAQFLKILLENNAGHTLFVNDAGFTPVPMAHLAGALAGSVIAASSCCALLRTPYE